PVAESPRLAIVQCQPRVERASSPLTRADDLGRSSNLALGDRQAVESPLERGSLPIQQANKRSPLISQQMEHVESALTTRADCRQQLQNGESRDAGTHRRGPILFESVPVLRSPGELPAAATSSAPRQGHHVRAVGY